MTKSTTAPRHDGQLALLAAPVYSVAGCPMTAVYPFSPGEALREFSVALDSLWSWSRLLPQSGPRGGTRSGAPAPSPRGRDSNAVASTGDATWRIRLLYLAGLMVTLPVVALTRLLPGSGRAGHDESIFVETNRAVLTALGYAFTV